jgi:CBS domain-containing protein
MIREKVIHLRVGTFSNIALAHPETPLLQILTLFLTRRISCIPIVDQQGHLTRDSLYRLSFGCLYEI